MGRDRRSQYAGFSEGGFQSTRPHGARLSVVGMDLIVETVSIHAPAWGATFGRRHGFDRGDRFNPRARMGRDSCLMERLPFLLGFNPRARMGRDPAKYLMMFMTTCFNPRARMGRDGAISLN